MLLEYFHTEAIDSHNFIRPVFLLINNYAFIAFMLSYHYIFLVNYIRYLRLRLTS